MTSPGTRSVHFRAACSDDAAAVADLHADSWRRHYRGAYADAFLDGDIVSERRAVWASRLAAIGPTATILAEDAGGLIGFVHVIFDEDHLWGSLIDNLHVRSAQRRGGLGTALLAQVADAIERRASAPAAYLWVLEQNTDAQGFYRARGGAFVERAPVPPPGGDASRLTGAPYGIRVAWPRGLTHPSTAGAAPDSSR
ncbi:MAG: GNAT family N-acetyltransferase [Microlunatus sp.]|nr:GNAT family N-acetyltransferase [Microlunatus sp.]